VSYQLLRNVLAAYALNLQFCVWLCATTGLARTVVWNYQVYPAYRSSDQMQDPHVARTCTLPFGGCRTLSEYQIWNRFQGVLIGTDV
jgi:hypothetical protein